MSYPQKTSESLFSEYPEIISVNDLMHILNIGKVLAYKLINDKEIKAVKIGREYKIIKESVIQMINKGE